MALTYKDLVAELKNRSNAKSASVKKADGYSVPTVPEQDPDEKGKPSVPKDPAATAELQKVPPASQTTTNSDVTPPASVPVVGRKIEGEEKPASDMVAKAAAIVNSLRHLRKNATASEISTKGSLPDDGGNDNVDKGNKGDYGSNQTITTGARGKNNPDANAKTSGAEDPSTCGPDACDPKKEKAPAVKGDSKGEVPSSTVNADATTKKSGDIPEELKKKDKAEKPMDAGAAAEGKEDAEKAAAEMIIDPQYAMKIASMVLSVEDGRAIVNRELQKAYGEAAADDIVKAAAFMEDRANELAQLEDSGVLAAQEYWSNMPDSEKQDVIKIANTLELAKTGMDEEEKQAFDQGAGAAAQMADAGAAEDQAPQMPGADEVSDEDIVAVLDQMVQSGEITPEIAAQIMQALQGGGEGGAEGAEGAEGGAEGAEGAEGGGMPPEMMAAAAGGAGGPPQGGMPPEMMGGAGGYPEGGEGEEELPPEEKEAHVLITKAASVALQVLAEMRQ